VMPGAEARGRACAVVGGTPGQRHR
jgi:hypothetical protein